MVFVKCLSYGWQIMIKVLIVDDEYIMRQGLKYMIDWEQEGFEIVGEATNGAEALQCIESLAPQVSKNRTICFEKRVTVSLDLLP